MAEDDTQSDEIESLADYIKASFEDFERAVSTVFAATKNLPPETAKAARFVAEHMAEANKDFVLRVGQALDEIEARLQDVESDEDDETYRVARHLVIDIYRTFRRFAAIAKAQALNNFGDAAAEWKRLEHLAQTMVEALASDVDEELPKLADEADAAGLEPGEDEDEDEDEEASPIGNA